MCIDLSTPNGLASHRDSLRTTPTVTITSARALEILSGDTTALERLRAWLSGSKNTRNNIGAGFDMLKDVIHSPGLARVLAHSCASNSELTTTDILDNLPLWPPILRAKKSLTPIERKLAQHMLSDVTLLECMDLTARSDSQTMQAVIILSDDNQAGYAWTPAQDTSDSSLLDFDENSMHNSHITSATTHIERTSNESIYEVFQDVFEGLVVASAVFVFLFCEGQTFLCVRHPEHQTLHISPVDHTGIDLQTFQQNISRISMEGSGSFGIIKPSESFSPRRTARDVNITELD